MPILASLNSAPYLHCCISEGSYSHAKGNAMHDDTFLPLQTEGVTPPLVEVSETSLPALWGEGAGMLQILQCGLNLSPRSMLSSSRIAAISSCTHVRTLCSKRCVRGTKPQIKSVLARHELHKTMLHTDTWADYITTLGRACMQA